MNGQTVGVLFCAEARDLSRTGGGGSCAPVSLHGPTDSHTFTEWRGSWTENFLGKVGHVRRPRVRVVFRNTGRKVGEEQRKKEREAEKWIYPHHHFLRRLPFPPKRLVWGMQNLHVSRNGKSRAQRAAGDSHAWVRFRKCRPYQALYAA